jgi:hypothetical protein
MIWTGYFTLYWTVLKAQLWCVVIYWNKRYVTFLDILSSQFSCLRKLNLEVIIDWTEWAPSFTWSKVHEHRRRHVTLIVQSGLQSGFQGNPPNCLVVFRFKKENKRCTQMKIKYFSTISWHQIYIKYFRRICLLHGLAFYFRKQKSIGGSRKCQYLRMLNNNIFH